MTTARPSLAEVDGVHLDARERWAVHSALLAQVDDMHAGGVYSWDEQDLAAARRALAALTGTAYGETPEGYGQSLTSRVIALSLLVPLYDLDHPEMTEVEWVEAERLVVVMAEEFGR